MYTLLIRQEQKAAFRAYMPHHFYSALAEPDVVALGLADADHRAAGLLVGRILGDWLQITWLYVAPAYRGQGLGQRLVSQALLSASQVKGLAGVYGEYEGSAWGDRLDWLFQGLGFTLTQEVKAVFRLTLAELAQAPLWQLDMTTGPVVPLKDTRAGQRLTYQQRLLTEDQVPALDLPIAWSAFHPGLSMIYLRQQEIRGGLLIQEVPEGLDLAFAHALPGCRALPALFYQAGKAALSLYPPETCLHIAATDEATAGLAQRLFPTLAPLAVTRAVCVAADIGQVF